MNDELFIRRMRKREVLQKLYLLPVNLLYKTRVNPLGSSSWSLLLMILYKSLIVDDNFIFLHFHYQYCCLLTSKQQVSLLNWNGLFYLKKKKRKMSWLVEKKIQLLDDWRKNILLKIFIFSFQTFFLKNCRRQNH